MNFSEQSMAAAAPSEVGQHYNLVSGPYIFGDFLNIIKIDLLIFLRGYIDPEIMSRDC